jgi:hypothetical protein
MNMNGLAKHYDRLTPRERFPLILAAGLRGDQAEHARLIRSAPSKSFSVPNFRGLAEAFERLSSLILMSRLELALLYNQISALLRNEMLAKQGAKDDLDLFNGLRMVAYRFLVRGRAWKELYAEGQIDAEALLKDLPGYDLVKLMEPEAGMVAFTPEEASDFMRKTAGESANVETVAETVAALREFLDYRAQSWT